MATRLGTLYSFRRCPYAIRARLAIAVSGVADGDGGLELREVKLSQKPEALLTASPKGTVPVLVLRDGTVIDESLDIMLWALALNDPEHWLEPRADQDAHIAENDGPFKRALDRYKYPNRSGPAPEGPAENTHAAQEDAFNAARPFLTKLNARLAGSNCLEGDHTTLADAAIFPFIRQFAAVNRPRFAAAFPDLDRWLTGWLQRAVFLRVMHKLEPWQPGNPTVYFGQQYPA